MNSRTIHVNMPEGCLDWQVARDEAVKHYPQCVIGLASRTVTYPNCDHWCDEECGHPLGMRYTFNIYTKEEELS